MFIIHYKISVKMCFLLSFKMIFYTVRNKYLTFKDFCIAYRIVVLATFHTDIMTHTSNTFSLGLVTYQLYAHKFQRKKYGDINDVIWTKTSENIITLHQLP